MKVMITVGAIFGFFGSLSASTDGEVNFAQAFACAAICAALVPLIARFGLDTGRRSERSSRKLAQNER